MREKELEHCQGLAESVGCNLNPVFIAYVCLLSFYIISKLINEHLFFNRHRVEVTLNAKMYTESVCSDFTVMTL